MATGVFGYVRGHVLRGYSNANGLLFCEFDEFMNMTPFWSEIYEHTLTEL